MPREDSRLNVVSPTLAHRPILLPCPRCMEQEANISLYLGDLGSGYTELKCNECEEAFSIGDIRNLFDRWVPVLRWIDSAPFPQG